jgi:putative transposase
MSPQRKKSQLSDNNKTKASTRPRGVYIECETSGVRPFSRISRRGHHGTCRTALRHSFDVCPVTARFVIHPYSELMNPRLKRYYGAGDLHFITCSCYRRQPLLGTANQRDLFLTVLEQVRSRYQFVVGGYVVMPEHIHPLIGEPQVKTLSTVMQALKIGFARRALAQARRRLVPPQDRLFDRAQQHIWQKRFYDFNVWTERKRIEKLRYMHRNPVKRGLAVSPELWRWSSFRAYAFGEVGPVRVNGWEVLQLKIRPPAA